MPLETSEAVHLLNKNRVFTVRSRDKKGRLILSIVGHYFPATLVSVEGVKKYLEKKVYPELEDQPFSIVYFNAHVEKSQNFPGIYALRAIYDSIPIKVRDSLKAVYFVHQGFQSRFFLATFGRFFFSCGFYGKVKYISRVDYLWEHVKRREIEIPEFVYEHDKELDKLKLIDFGIESDHHPRLCRAQHFESPAELYATACIY